MQLRLRIGETEDYPWGVDTVTVREYIAIEEQADLTPQEFIGALSKGTPRSLLIAAWLCRRRVDPSIELADVDFPLAELQMVQVGKPKEETPVPSDEAAPPSPRQRGTKKRATPSATT